MCNVLCKNAYVHVTSLWFHTRIILYWYTCSFTFAPFYILYSTSFNSNKLVHQTCRVAARNCSYTETMLLSGLSVMNLGLCSCIVLWPQSLPWLEIGLHCLHAVRPPTAGFDDYFCTLYWKHMLRNVHTDTVTQRYHQMGRSCGRYSISNYQETM